MDRFDCSARQSPERVADSIEEHKNGETPGDGPQPDDSPEHQRSQREQDRDQQDQSRKPVSEFENGHGKPGQLLADCQYGRIVDGKEAGEGFVGDVNRERAT